MTTFFFVEVTSTFPIRLNTHIRHTTQSKPPPGNETDIVGMYTSIGGRVVRGEKEEQNNESHNLYVNQCFQGSHYKNKSLHIFVNKKKSSDKD